jgi:hypothetical protein
VTITSFLFFASILFFYLFFTHGRNEVTFWRNLGIYLLPWTVNSDVEKQYTMQYLQLPIITDAL